MILFLIHILKVLDRKLLRCPFLKQTAPITILPTLLSLLGCKMPLITEWVICVFVFVLPCSAMVLTIFSAFAVLIAETRY